MARNVKDSEERKQELLDTAMHLFAARDYGEYPGRILHTFLAVRE